MNSFERRAHQRGYRLIAGIDEAGRGPLAGPVVAAAVILPHDYENPEINDSKKLTPRKRERLYEVIEHDALSIGLGVVEASVIDDVNVFQATLMAMKEAVSNLSLKPDYLIIDGSCCIFVPLPQEAVVKGDSRSISVASASIIAKVSRDSIMEIYHRQFPQYNFLKNKGYGTGEHREAIKKYGPCKIHRRSFRIRDKSPLQVNVELEF
ncbi:MAG: ribonuclease HII [Deltaproteobacteria bacterium]|jgi:ribonuclease HII|nr:ribonuclease HII [Deltaproteobacteria bacterium]